MKPESKTTTLDVRPIGARALKSAIDTLRPYLFGATILDLYSGQGRFGFACLQEHSSRVIFVENNKHLSAEIVVRTHNLKKEALVQVVCTDALRFLAGVAKKNERFDIVFADPPFPFWNSRFESELLRSVLVVMKSDSIFLVKYPTRMIACKTISSLWKSSVFGESKLVYFKYGKEQGN